MVNIIRDLLETFVSDLFTVLKKERSAQQLTSLHHTIWKGRLYALLSFEFSQDHSEDIHEGCCETQCKFTRLVILSKICKTEPMPRSQLLSASVGLK